MQWSGLMTKQIDLTGYKLTFSDEFNSFARRGDPLSGGTWDTSLGSGTVRSLSGNSEMQIYVEPEYKGTSTRALGINPFTVANGALTITAKPVDAASAPYLGDSKYTSGMITTQQTFTQKYGYFEMRADLPEGQGLWPAFWTLFHQTSGAEFDIVEVLGHDTTTVHQTVHQPSGNSNMFTTRDLDWGSGYHTYGMKWTDAKITYYIDGVERGSQANEVHTPAYMIANLAVGGSWPGAPDATTKFPAEMKIDYIRVYSNDAATAAVSMQPISSPDGADTRPIGADVKGGFSTPIVTPNPTPVPTPVPDPTGPDKLVLHVAEDAWLGDAKFTVFVDGNQLGGVQTATALRGAGAWQTVTLGGDFGADGAAGAQNVIVRFVNDGFDAAGNTRNLYVKDIEVNGLHLDGSAGTNTSGPMEGPIANMYNPGTLTFDASKLTVPVPTPPPSTMPVWYHANARDAVPAEGTLSGTTITKSASFALVAGDSNLILKGSGNFAGTGNAAANIIVGNANSNSLSGRDGDDHLYGGAGSDRLVGGSGADRLYGGSGDDTLRGSGSQNYLIGGTGVDKFILTGPSFSKLEAASRDVILDFSKSEGDRIDVSGIDANALVAGNQAFRFIGTNAFTGTSGELHTFKQSEILLLSGDVNGDRISDFHIEIYGVPALDGASLFF
jgi:beta-glucanase (GH16 family)